MEQTFYSIHDYYISHHGIKGQKWGVRRWRNEDGTLTEAGKRKYEKLLKKYTTTNSRGNVHLNEGKLARRSSVRGTAIATSAAMLGKASKQERKDAAFLDKANKRMDEAAQAFMPTKHLGDYGLSGYSFKRTFASDAEEREWVRDTFANMDNAEAVRAAAIERHNDALATQKKVRAVAAGITAVSAASAAKEMKDLKFLMDNAKAYGGKSVASLEKEIKEIRNKRIARTTANVTGVLLSYHIFNK